MFGKNLARGALIAAGLAYLPFLVSSQYLYPLGIHEWDWISGLAWGDGTESWWERQQIWRHEIGGRHTAAAIFGSLSSWYSLSSFRVSVLLILLLVPFVLWTALRKLLPANLGGSIAAFAWLFFLHQLTNTYDSLLRFTCLPIYLLPVALLALLAVSLQRQYRVGFSMNWKLLIPALLIIVIVGTNELSIVHLFLLLGGCLIAYYLDRKMVPVGGGILLGCALLVAMFALGASGNYNRMELYPDGRSTLEIILLSLGTSIFLIADWCLDSLLLIGTIIILFLQRYFGQKQNLPLLQRPLIWTICLFALLPASLFPLLYATSGSSLPERVVDTLYLLFTIVFFLTALSWQQHLLTWPKANGLPQGVRLVLPLLFVYMLGQIFLQGLTIDRSLESRHLSPLRLIQVEANAGKAYQQLLLGVPAQYAQQMREVEEQVKGCTMDTCWINIQVNSDFIGYDPLYDRLHRNGELGMSQYLNGMGSQRVMYKPQNPN